MRVKLNTVMCGPAGSFDIGQQADLDDVQARALINGGYATEVLGTAATAVIGAPETAVRSPHQTAAMPRAKRAKKVTPGHGL